MYKKQPNVRRDMNSETVFDLVNYGFLTLIAIITVYPLIFILSASISEPDLVFAGKVWLFPKNVSFIGYEIILKYKEIWIGYRNSLLYVALGVPVSLFLTLTAAYPLSRRDFLGRNPFMLMLTITMFFGGGLIPTYLLVRDLGLIDNIFVMVIGPGAVGVWNIIIARTYFQNNIPDELREAAEIDGCSDLRFLGQIVLPLSSPIIAVICLFYGVEKWNSFFVPMIYFANRTKYPLQLIIREILSLYTVSTELLQGVQPSQLELIVRITNSIRYGVIIVATIPVLLVYPLVQKHFVRGIMIGAIKG